MKNYNKPRKAVATGPKYQNRTLAPTDKLPPDPAGPLPNAAEALTRFIELAKANAWVQDYATYSKFCVTNGFNQLSKSEFDAFRKVQFVREQLAIRAAKRGR